MKRAFLIASLVICSSQLVAEHIIGGEMYYTCEGNGLYTFTMKLYRDCNSSGAPFDNPANFGVFDENNQLVMSFQKALTSTSPVDASLESPCLSLPPDICVAEGTYQFTLQLPSLTQDYQIVYQRCCRNQTIVNLTSPGAQGLTIVAEVPAFAEVGCNNRPFYNNFPPPILCVNEYIAFDHSATDPDGDSLAYSLCAPYVGANQNDPAPVVPSSPPYAAVNWAPGYNAANPVAAAPALSIDPQSGLLTGTPNALGQYVVGVCVEEWRDGQLLSVNTRDFQFNVAYCDPLSEALIAEPTEEDLCEDLNLTFINEGSTDNFYSWNFGVAGTEDDTSNLYSPNFTFPDTGTYLITLISNPGFFCSDTAILELPLYTNMSLTVALTDFACVNGEKLYSFEASGAFDMQESVVTWNFGPDASPPTATGITAPNVSFDTEGLQTISAVVTNNACSAQSTYPLTIPGDPVVTIAPQDTFCAGLHYSFEQSSQNASIFQWDFGVLNLDSDVATGASVDYTFPEEGTYTVSLTASLPLNCPVTVTEEFDIHSLLLPEVQPSPIYCLDGNMVDLAAAGSYSATAQFEWQISNAQPSTSNLEAPQNIHFTSAGTHQVSLSVSENGCQRSASGEVIIHANPIADFEAVPTEGCAPLEVRFINRSTTQSSSVAYEYDTGDGSSLSAGSATHTYQLPGSYDVSFALQNLNGCIDGDDRTKQELITVWPTPKAGFNVASTMVSSVDPQVVIIDQSEGATGCNFYFDGQEFQGCNFTHTLEHAVPQELFQTVYNEFGCTATSSLDVYISDHLAYIPNAFTPDGDGLNDFFVPVTTGAAQVDLYIYDRWGNLIFSEEDTDSGWNGASADAKYFADNSVFGYLVVITDHLGWRFEYRGNVTLLK